MGKKDEGRNIMKEELKDGRKKMKNKRWRKKNDETWIKDGRKNERRTMMKED